MRRCMTETVECALDDGSDTSRELQFSRDTFSSKLGLSPLGSYR